MPDKQRARLTRHDLLMGYYYTIQFALQLSGCLSTLLFLWMIHTHCACRPVQRLEWLPISCTCLSTGRTLTEPVIAACLYLQCEFSGLSLWLIPNLVRKLIHLALMPRVNFWGWWPLCPISGDQLEEMQWNRRFDNNIYIGHSHSHYRHFLKPVYFFSVPIISVKH